MADNSDKNPNAGDGRDSGVIDDPSYPVTPFRRSNLIASTGLIGTAIAEEIRAAQPRSLATLLGTSQESTQDPPAGSSVGRSQEASQIAPDALQIILGKLDDMNRQFHGMDTKLTRMENKFDKKFAEQETRVNQILDEHSQKINQHEKSIEQVRREAKAELGIRLEHVKKGFTDQIEATQAAWNERLDETVARDMGKVNAEIGVIRTVVVDHTEKIAENQVEIISNKDHIAELTRKQETLQRDVRTIRVQGPIRENPAHQFKIKQKPPTFEGLSRERPMKFLRELRQYNEAAGLTAVETKALIHQSLQGTAKDWWHLVEGEVTDLDQFKDVFLERYWDDEIQNQARKELDIGRYRPEGNLTRVEYATQKFGTARDLRCALADRDIILDLKNHFEETVATAVQVQRTSTLSDFLELLGQFDRSNPNKAKTTYDNRNSNTGGNKNRPGYQGANWKNNTERTDQTEGKRLDGSATWGYGGNTTGRDKGKNIQVNAMGVAQDAQTSTATPTEN